MNCNNMSNAHLCYQLPESFDTECFIEQLQTKLMFKVALRHSGQKTFYDSFDWRLYKVGMALELDESDDHKKLSLTNLKHAQVLMTTELRDMPQFAQHFVAEDFRTQLVMVLKMRALLPHATINYDHSLLQILNRDQKTIARLAIETYKHCSGRLTIQLIKGYDNKINDLKSLLRHDFNLQACTEPLLETALALDNKKPAAYAAKLQIEIDAALRSDVAIRYVFSLLLSRLKQNVPGCIANIDSEFLHEFRIAVRKTRSGLSQFKQIFPKNSLSPHVEFFSWLGQISGHVRDIDVYLLDFDLNQNYLPESARADLEPLRELLMRKQAQAYEQLAQHLQSERFNRGLENWQNFVQDSAVPNTDELTPAQNIKQYADQRLWKIYTRLLKEAKAIDTQSPAVALHNLRKTAKKLRYLIEFFQSLYPQTTLRLLLKSLKTIQDILGQFQDLEVQIASLQHYRLELQELAVPAVSIEAIDVLIKELERRKLHARLEFVYSFDKFNEKHTHEGFKQLWHDKRTRSGA